MRYEIVHALRYDYSSVVGLGPHRFRLLPRSDASQQVISTGWDIRPIPAGCARILDMNGNDVLEVWFANNSRSLALRFRATIETRRQNPFDFVARHPLLPMDYPVGGAVLAPFRIAGEIPSDIAAFCQLIREESHGNSLEFLSLLCRRINEKVTWETREEGAARSPAETWTLQRGACRDLTLLFMACCRQEGFAARFVSGYFEENPQRSRRELHAWAEVYVDGGGWRGFDPTAGLAVADRHIALASGPSPEDAAPIDGAFYGNGITAKMGFELSLQRLDPLP